MKSVGKPNLTTPLRDIHPMHFLLHAIQAAIVFSLGVGADLVIMEMKSKLPHRVRWQTGEIQEKYSLRSLEPPPLGRPIELGFSENGILVWRCAATTNQK